MKRVRRRIARLLLRVTGAQLVTALVLAMLAIAVVGILMAWSFARDEILGSVDDRLRRRTQFVQDRYDRIVVTLERGLVAAAKDPGVARLDPSGCTGLRAALGPAIAYVRAVATVDAHGGIVCADRAWPTILDTLGFLPTAIASADRRVFGRPTADEAGGVPVAGLALAIRDGTTPRGAVVLALDLQVLSQLIAGVLADDGSHVVMFDGSGRVVAATEAGRLATSMPADFTAAVRDAGRGSFPRVVDLDDEPMVVRQGGVAGTD